MRCTAQAILSRLAGDLESFCEPRFEHASVMTAETGFLGARQNLSNKQPTNRESPLSVLRAYRLDCYVLEGVNDRILDHHVIPAVVGDGVVKQLRRSRV